VTTQILDGRVLPLWLAWRGLMFLSRKIALEPKDESAQVAIHPKHPSSSAKQRQWFLVPKFALDEHSRVVGKSSSGAGVVLPVECKTIRFPFGTFGDWRQLVRL